MKAYCLFILLLSQAYLGKEIEFTFKIVTLKPTVSQAEWDDYKEGLATIKEPKTDYNVLVYLLQEVGGINESQFEDDLGLTAGYHVKKFVDGNFATILAFQSEDVDGGKDSVTEALFNDVKVIKNEKVDGAQFVHIECQDMHYLFVNTDLNTDEEKANQEFQDIYSKITGIRNEVNYGTADVTEIYKKNKGKFPDEDDFVSIVWAGSFTKSIPRDDETQAEFKADTANEELDFDAFAEKIKGWVKGGTGPLANWEKRDAADYEAREDKFEKLGKTIFKELEINFEPSRGYSTKKDADEEGGGFVNKEEMSYTDRILYFTSTTKDEFKDYTLVKDCNVSTSKPVAMIIHDVQDYDDHSERVRKARKLSLVDRIKDFL